MNKFFIVIMLVALLYALYLYQQQTGQQKKKKIKKPLLQYNSLPKNQEDDIQLDGLSQIDLGSMESSPYKQDSLFGSRDNLSAMFNDTGTDDFFN